MLWLVNIGQKHQKGATERKRAKIENPYLNAYVHINMNSHISYQENPLNGLGGVAIMNFFLLELQRGVTLQEGARSSVSVLSKVYIFIKFRGSHLKI